MDKNKENIGKILEILEKTTTVQDQSWFLIILFNY